MAATKLAPLSTQVPIVDEDGNPTPYFQQLMQIFIDEKNAAVDDITETVEDLDDLVAVVAALELDDLADVDTTGVADGDVLTYDSGSGDWVAEAPSSGSGTFKGALVGLSSSITTANYSAGVNIPWTSETYDTDNIHSKSSTVTITIASPGVVTWNSHGLINGTPVVFTTTGALPTGITAGTTYFVVSSATNTFSVAATSGGAAINTTGSQSGTHTCTILNTCLVVPTGVSYVRLRAQFGLLLGTSNMVTILGINKNGSSSFGGFPVTRNTIAVNLDPEQQTSSPVLAVSPGDFFQANLLISGDTSVTIDSARTWFSMEVVA